MPSAHEYCSAERTLHLWLNICVSQVLPATPMLNEYCGVAVQSVAKDGEAPELNPGWVHRRKNSYSTVRHAHIPAAFNLT